MNIYTLKFCARCPADGATVGYTLKVHSGRMIRVEELRAAVDAITEGFQEDIADKLSAQFGGSQTITGEHQGVGVETIRPHIALWSRASES